jgi:hypothetical protein
MRESHITYERNPQYTFGEGRMPRLFASIDLSRYGLEGRIQRLPIYFRMLDRPVGPIRQTYSTSIAGLYLEKGNRISLEKSIAVYLGALIHFGRLPEYVFRLGDNAWPIYRLPDQLVTRYPGNPVMGAETIGELRNALADHFKTMGLIRNRKEVEILLFSRHDLQLYSPVCALRTDGIADIQVFPVHNGQGTTFTAPMDTTTISVPENDALGILDLHQAVGEHLIRQGKLREYVALTVRKLSADSWGSLRAALQPYGIALAYRDGDGGRSVKRSVPVFANGKNLCAARANRLTQTTLYVAPGIRDLQKQLGDELHRLGKIRKPDYVTVDRL